MSCKTCGGGGSIVNFGPIEWWPCPACGGAGARVVYRNPEIRLPKGHMKKRKAKAA